MNEKLEYKTLLINPDELWLKGKNRPAYFQKFKANVHNIMRFKHKEKVQYKNENQRLVVRSEKPFGEEVYEALKKLPGVNSFLPTLEVLPNIDSIREASIKVMVALDPAPRTFKVQASRTDKSFPVQSMEMNRSIGGLILSELSGLKVDVHTPDVMLYIKVMRESAYVSAFKVRGVGGLPVGMSGHLVTLLSGGFDSPVASYQMAKRGCKQTLAFFYAYPFVGEEVKEKIIELSKALAPYIGKVDLYIIPFGNVQKAIAKDCFHEYRTLLFRYFMIKCSDYLADKVGAEGLLTGDALAQVSSQTLHNMAVLDQAVEKPIMRPLIGFNKVEIIELAKKIGTHDISILPHDDACSLFAPKHPIIKPNLKYWEKFHAANDYSQLIEDAVEQSEIITLYPN